VYQSLPSDKKLRLVVQPTARATGLYTAAATLQELKMAAIMEPLVAAAAFAVGLAGWAGKVGVPDTDQYIESGPVLRTHYLLLYLSTVLVRKKFIYSRYGPVLFEENKKT
jgi:hypothetical protein